MLGCGFCPQGDSRSISYRGELDAIDAPRSWFLIAKATHAKWGSLEQEKKTLTKLFHIEKYKSWSQFLLDHFMKVWISFSIKVLGSKTPKKRYYDLNVQPFKTI